MNSDVQKLVHEIFTEINRDNYFFLIHAADRSYGCELYEVDDNLVTRLMPPNGLFDRISDSIHKNMMGTGITIIFPSKEDSNKPATISIPHNNPEIFDSRDICELVLFQQFGVKPKDEKRQQILTATLAKEKIKKTLVYACYENNTEKIFERLKNVKKTQLDQMLKHAGTPLGLCAINNNVPCFKAIAEAGANVGRSSLAFTPLHLAFKHSSDIVRYIYSNHPDVFEKEVKKKGYYLLSRTRDIDMFNLLLEYGIDPNTFDLEFPHLHNFATAKNVVGMEFCLQHGADINLKDKRKRTALDKARSANNWEGVALLEKNGAK